MGEVYRARDTKLGREVAVKVLPRVLARDPERRARFEREARLLASLNHPNIATLHGLERSGDTHFLVMELVGGETLVERIARGPIPIQEALPLFQQLAEALEAAHETGIIHRDLKPANIKITEDGRVKVLDFGLAKAFVEELPPEDLSRSPTITRQGTETGVILGTAAYMSPEQARGKTLDKRTDIWSFGCVLYQMLTGRAAFLGETVSDTIARILEREPDWEAMPEETPPFIRLLLHRCLQKDAKDRLHDIADARIEIRDASSESYRALSTGEVVTAAQHAPAWWRRATLWVVAVAGLFAVIAVVAYWGPWQDRLPEQSPQRFATTLPAEQTIPNVGSWGSAVALSPDGSQLIYVAQEGDTQRLYRRSLDSFEAEPIPGTEGALAPFLSPDGGWIGFYADDQVKKVSPQGGALSTICNIEQTTFRGGNWGSDDHIVYSHCTYGLKRVSAAGGTPEVFTSVADIQNEGQHSYPQVLPGGEAVLYTISNTPEDVRIAVRHVVTGEAQTLIEQGTHARYVPTGHIVYAWGGELLAVPFDLEKLEISGLPVRVLDDVLMEGDPLAAHFSISDNGTLAYVPGGLVRAEQTLVWADHSGTIEPLSFQPAFATLRISPDGKRVLVSRPETRDPRLDLWVYDLERGIERRLTDKKGEEWWAVWTPDSQHVIYNSARKATLNLYSVPVDGSAPEQMIAESEYWLQPFSCSPDGMLAYQESEHPTRGVDIWVLPLEENGQPQPFLQTQNNEGNPTFSPDGKWLAYVTDESGQWEVNVRPYPGPGPVTQVSTEGGFEPIWSPDGREIYYRRDLGDQVMAVSFEPTESSPRVGKPRLLFEGRYFVMGMPIYGRTYDLTPDGKRFLLIRDSEPPPPATQYNVVLNWFTELEGLVPSETH